MSIYGTYFGRWQEMWDNDMPSSDELKDLIMEQENISGEGGWLLWCEDHGYEADVESQKSYDQLIEFMNDKEKAARGHHDDTRCDEMRGT